MKIKYLKNAPLGQMGDVGDVPDFEAVILIKLGYAKEVKETKLKRTKTEADTETES